MAPRPRTYFSDVSALFTIGDDVPEVPAEVVLRCRSMDFEDDPSFSSELKLDMMKEEGFYS
jgi:hypothetical protein